MPYIPQEQRNKVDPAINELAVKISETAGSEPPDGILNYAITRLLQHVIIKGKPTYMLLERVNGLLGCVDKEFYRRCSAPYENTKAKINGDVFTWVDGGQLPGAPV